MDERTQFLFFEKLAVLLKSGIPLDRAVSLMANHADTPEQRAACRTITERLKGGAPFREALEGSTGAFAPDAIEAAAAAASGGNLPEAISNISDSLRLRYKRKILSTGATIYYLILIVLVLLLFTRITPVFAKMFQDMGSPLPGFTIFVLNISSWFRLNWIFLFFLFLIGFVIWLLRQRRIIGDIALYIPLIGKYSALMDSATFARSVAVSLRNGVQLPRAIELGASALKNKGFAKVVKTLPKRIKDGNSVGDLLDHTWKFPRNMADIIVLGEQKGDLTDAFFEAARLAEEEIEAKKAHPNIAMAIIAYSTLIIVLGMVIIAMYLPLFVISNV